MYHKIISMGYIDYNPEGSYISPFYSHTDDYKKCKVFINPPFSILNKSEWLTTIGMLINNNNEILLLMPAIVDTKQFHKLLEWGFTVEFIKGRLRYNDDKPAPFPSLFMRYKK